jgi:hypothetical protein
MKLELLILAITSFVLLNTYFEGKLINKLKNYEKVNLHKIENWI